MLVPSVVPLKQLLSWQPATSMMLNPLSELRPRQLFSAALGTVDRHLLLSLTFQISPSGGSVPILLADIYHLPNPLKSGGLGPW